VFVTVGTTKFDELIEEVLSKETLRALQDRGYDGLHVQYGTGKAPDVSMLSSDDFPIEAFSLKPSLEGEFSNSALVIGHAGVGTIFEALEKDKDVLAVPNEHLMNNHQVEIAEIMARLLLTSDFPSLLTPTGIRRKLDSCMLLEWVRWRARWE